MGFTPGQLYKNITALGEDFSEGDGEGKLLLEKNIPYVDYCKKMARKFPAYTRGAKFPEQHEKAINFLGWKLSAGEFQAAVKGTFVQYIIPLVIIVILLFVFGIGIEIGEFSSTAFMDGGLFAKINPDLASQYNLFFAITLMLFMALGAKIYELYSYPITEADAEKNRSLTYVPEMVGYMIMSMKLVPNLEKAIEFSAKHGKGKIANDFKKLIWDFQIGIHTSISEGLDSLAYSWGEYSSELKESLMKIRASVMEPSESHRYALLDKTMLEVLDSVKEKMEDYARSLNQPSMMLFYLGVLLPLILIIVLPVGSAFSGSAMATTEVLFLVYCVAIPAAAFYFAKKVISQRPPTYEPPFIDDNFRGLPPKWQMDNKLDARMVAILIFIIGIILSVTLSTQGFPPKFILGDDEILSQMQFLPPDLDLGELSENVGRDPDYFAGVTILEIGNTTIPLDFFVFQIYDIRQGQRYNILIAEGLNDRDAFEMATKDYLIFTSNPKNDPTKFILWSGIIITLVVVASFLLYHKNIYKRRAQLEIIQMEDEFKESMYVIASRMGENKPVESALKQTTEFLPNLTISKRVFAKTVENIELMGLPLEGAVFDPVYGSMKGIPSKILHTAMKLLVDSVSLGVEVASRTLMSLSLQMENMDKVNKSLKVMVSDVTTTMTTMAVFIGPIVLGITVALQRVIMMTLAGVVSDPAISDAQTDIGGIGAIAGNTLDINQLFSLTVSEFQKFASPLVFLIIISIYVIEILIIMIYFTTKIQEDNDLLFKINLAKYLPIAVTIFLITALISSMAVGGMLS